MGALLGELVGDFGSVTLGTAFLPGAFVAGGETLPAVGESFGGLGSVSAFFCAGAFWDFLFSTFEVLPFF